MTATQKRAEAVRLITDRCGKNSYTQARPCYVFGKPEGSNPGYGDCSGTVQAILKRAAGIDIGSNTSAQIDRRAQGKVIEMAASGQLVPTESLLLPGDCVYYRGNTAHTWGVGHVEMYHSKGWLMGHGSGMGPSMHKLESYSKGRAGAKSYLCTIRWILDDDAPATPPKLGDRALSQGMVAPDVGELQFLLVNRGYKLGTYGPNGDGVDCDYGTKTAAAVKEEQKHAGLIQTGNADLLTIEHIIACLSGGKTPSTKQYVLVTGGTVNVRKGASTNHSILGVVKSGEKYESTGRTENGWYEIIYKMGTAWISGKMSEIVK